MCKQVKLYVLENPPWVQLHHYWVLYDHLLVYQLKDRLNKRCHLFVNFVVILLQQKIIY